MSSKEPFFSQFVEAQTLTDTESQQVAGGCGGWVTTLKYPSDDDEGGPVVTLKYPSDDDEGYVTLKYPSDDDEG